MLICGGKVVVGFLCLNGVLHLLRTNHFMRGLDILPVNFLCYKDVGISNPVLCHGYLLIQIVGSFVLDENFYSCQFVDL